MDFRELIEASRKLPQSPVEIIVDQLTPFKNEIGDVTNRKEIDVLELSFPLRKRIAGIVSAWVTFIKSIFSSEKMAGGSSNIALGGGISLRGSAKRVYELTKGALDAAKNGIGEFAFEVATWPNRLFKLVFNVDLAEALTNYMFSKSPSDRIFAFIAVLFISMLSSAFGIAMAASVPFRIVNLSAIFTDFSIRKFKEKKVQWKNKKERDTLRHKINILINLAKDKTYEYDGNRMSYNELIALGARKSKDEVQRAITFIRGLSYPGKTLPRDTEVGSTLLGPIFNFEYYQQREVNLKHVHDIVNIILSDNEELSDTQSHKSTNEFIADIKDEMFADSHSNIEKLLKEMRQELAELAQKILEKQETVHENIASLPDEIYKNFASAHANRYLESDLRQAFLKKLRHHRNYEDRFGMIESRTSEARQDWNVQAQEYIRAKGKKTSLPSINFEAAFTRERQSIKDTENDIKENQAKIKETEGKIRDLEKSIQQAVRRGLFGSQQHSQMEQLKELKNEIKKFRREIDSLARYIVRTNKQVSFNKKLLEETQADINSELESGAIQEQFNEKHIQICLNFVRRLEDKFEKMKDIAQSAIDTKNTWDGHEFSFRDYEYWNRLIDHFEPFRFLSQDMLYKKAWSLERASVADIFTKLSERREKLEADSATRGEDERNRRFRASRQLVLDDLKVSQTDDLPKGSSTQLYNALSNPENEESKRVSRLASVFYSKKNISPDEGSPLGLEASNILSFL